ncbi:hypothetical protein [Streptomyces marincola]|uniref:Uncharacterized protein n=1 Tax=Streptomyces marincola TaxID=2878388 RepID=A0A1W7D1Q2_9ACTN|nr:hypothetical protein [Streptomyces marincola]ARQ70956.1 hypothetical protein CAG99_20805 [Streptomyces marincola]
MAGTSITGAAGNAAITCPRVDADSVVESLAGDGRITRTGPVDGGGRVNGDDPLTVAAHNGVVDGALGIDPCMGASGTPAVNR